MKLAIMQPYLFPYLGYFQLINAVDHFVVYDDVNYINRGWINRNFILGKGEAQRITLSLNGASQNKKINNITINDDREKLFKTIQQNYSKAPMRSKIIPIIRDILFYDENNLAKFLFNSLVLISNYVGIQVKWHVSSTLKKDNSLKGDKKILSICEELGASQYINLPGGRTLYEKEDFSAFGIELLFIKQKNATYRQFEEGFTPNLSFLDVLMFNDRDECLSLLEEYDLV